MGFNGSEEGPDAGACLRKMLKGGVPPPRFSGSYSQCQSLLIPSHFAFSPMNKWWDFIHHWPRAFFTSSSIIEPPPSHEEQMFGGAAFSGVPHNWWPPSASDPTQTWVSTYRQREGVGKCKKRLHWETICWKRWEVGKQERQIKNDCGRGIKWVTRDHWSAESAKSALNCKCRSCALNLYNMFVWEGTTEKRDREQDNVWIKLTAVVFDIGMCPYSGIKIKALLFGFLFKFNSIPV